MRKLVVLKIVQTCQLCPTQWEGITADDREFYVRLRWDYLTIQVGEPGDHNEFAGVNGQYLVHTEYNELMSYSDLKGFCKENCGIVLPENESEKIDWQN